jgi:exopolysaccharide biosynthesis polyprenyl glycosylphosphotransferase
MSSRRSSQRLVHVSWHFAMDLALFMLAFIIGIFLRFIDEPTVIFNHQWQYYPSVVWGALVFAAACYIFGLYTPQIFNQNLLTRALVLTLNLGLALLLMSAMFYLNFSSRVGRGVMAYSAFIGFVGILVHHAFILKSLKGFRERVALVVTDEQDELETRLFKTFWGGNLELVGIIHSDHYQPRHEAANLGPASRVEALLEQHRIDRLLCTNRGFADPALCQQFCRLRYSGETVMPLINLCEDVYQFVPLDLMTPEWLMNASASPHMLYIKKTKRGFDIASSLAGLLALGPVVALAALLVKLTSTGPVLYRQIRAGRFGRTFQMIKLRTMRVDAEKDGAVWSKANDDRVTPVGKFLRRYRIDEIPQLINVLRGEMSFVGPRPERPEFVDELARQIPFYRERLMVQPGITGWAQVNYPYGSSVEDARRKLEYDLYYMKHMSVFLDFFILVDTVRIILRGGLDEAHKHLVPSYQAAERLTPAAEETPPATAKPANSQVSG